MINEFINKFCNIELEYIQIKDSFYLLNEELKQKYNNLNENSIALDQPEHIGLYLGKINKNKFIPSFNLLEIISKNCNKKAIIKSRASWLFLCGRDAFNKSIIKSTGNEEILVLNEKDEILGYGFKDKNGIKNLLDRGDFLRREK
ncbi:MAG: hypothetical protein ACMXX8_01300 [Candidatus Woesearchaeota archaeon]